MKIGSTSDYSQFVFSSANRPLNTENQRYWKLLESMKKYGWLQSFPMTCVPFGNKRQIVDGQNRFTAAQELGISVLYVMVQTTSKIDIAEINCTQRPWSLDDYIGSHDANGDENYHFLKDFAARHKLPTLRAASMLIGESAASGNARELIRKGTFKVKDVEYAERVASLANAIAAHVPWSRNTYLLGALCEAVRVKEFSDAKFIQKVDTHASVLEKKATQDGYREMVEEIYNRSSRSPMPLKFKMQQVSKDRNPIKK